MFKPVAFFIGILLLITSCATYKTQISKGFTNWEHQKNTIANHTIYLIGDAGNSTYGNPTLKALKKELEKENTNSTLIFLGDNVYPKGIPAEKSKKQNIAIQRLNSQLEVTENFKGKTFFIPGNHDWYNGLDGLKKQEKLVEEKLGKNSFLPENGCPLEVVHVNNDIDIIVIDSEWYITNWDKHPKINDKCNEIKTRDKFFIELEGLINKSQNKFTIIAMHHPTVSRGPHGGFNSFKKHIFPFSNYVPLPGLGSVLQTVRKTSGLNPQDLQGYRYNELVKRISTLAQEHDKIIFASGHEHNLQYLYNHGIPQIVSGAGSKTSPTYLGNQKGFTSGQNGYVKLSLYNNQKVIASYKSKGKTIFETSIFKDSENLKTNKYSTNSVPNYVETNIYPKKQTDKNKLYKFFWGDHYRDSYGKIIKAKTVLLDTLYGGLTIVKKGGGHQSKSLRLKDKNGKQYVMRALKKSAIRFLQTVAFKKDHVANHLKGTYTENLLYDFYTSAHPYTPFVIGTLSDSLKIAHTVPKLFYVPKQNRLIPFDDEFGDALYMIEERPEKHHSTTASFGFPDDIISTDDLFAKLRKSKKNKLDEKSYVTARLFDMVIGDWDRHVDQWRWAVHKDGKHNIYKPIPRDRDQAFSNYDGIILEGITTFVDAVKLMQTYKPEIRNLFRFSDEPYPMDVSLLQEKDYNLWIEQAHFIQNKLTDDIIDSAFKELPKNVQNETIENIKTILRYRRDHVVEIAEKYRNIMEKFAIVKGTDKDDYFEISADKNTTTIKVFNLKKGIKSKLHFSRSFNNQNTKNIWVYGLDDKDVFKVINTHQKSPKIRLIGGQNKDEYHIADTDKKVFIHDFKSKKNNYHGKATKHLSDKYNNNIYQYKKVKDYTQNLLPLIAVNPDDGFAVGLNYNNTRYGYNRHPFTSKHKIDLKYYTATNGFDITHQSEFATYLYRWNGFVKTRFTSTNFSYNFFGFGNNTTNNNGSLNYNRVKTEIKKIEPGFVWNNLKGASLAISIPIKSYQIESTTNRFIETVDTSFNNQLFTGIRTTLLYNEINNNALPTKGFQFELDPEWEYNTTENSSLVKLKTALGIIHPLTSNKKWTIDSKIRSQLNIGTNNFMPYQSAFIGGNNGLRGFRNERFAGKSSFVQNTNLCYAIKKIKTPILPVTYGVSVGFDYGRVWVPNENVNNWHNSYGTSLWLSAPGITKANFNLFNSEEGLRFTFGVGVNW